MLVLAPTAHGSCGITVVVHPDTIVRGQSATISWTGSSANTGVTIAPGVGYVAGSSGSINVTPTVTTTYTITANCTDGSTSAPIMWTVTVLQPPTVTFSAAPASIGSGQTSTLSWTTSNATSVSIDHGLGSQPLTGSVSVSPGATTTYTLTATGSGGTTTTQATVTVTAPVPPQITFSAAPPTIGAGQAATLAWAVTNATSVSIDHGIGVVPTSGSRVVTPSQTTTYTLTATGAGGTRTATATVTIVPPPTIVAFTVTPTMTLPGGTVTLAWQVLDATLVVIDPEPGAQPFAGSLVLTPKATTTYTLTATSLGGTRVAQATVIVGGRRRAAKH